MRLQARRHGAGLAVSEMVSSFGLHYRNERTMRELMRKFYPWYLDRLDAPREVTEELQRRADLLRARELVASLAGPVAQPAL